MPYLLPRTTRDALGTRVPKNLGLLLYLYPAEPAEDDADEKKRKPPAFREMERSSATLLDPDLMRKLEARQESAVEALVSTARPGRCFSSVPLQLEASCVCGLSQPTSLGTGLTLLRPYGFPYIPGTTWKGACRSWLAEVLVGRLNLKESDQTRVLNECGASALLGKPGENDSDDGGLPSKVQCFDALPVSASVRVGVMTPHHQGWYTNPAKEPPAGFNNPVPVPLLEVANDSRFVFRFVAPETAVLDGLRARAKDLAVFGIDDFSTPSAFIKVLLISAAHHKGFGGRTSRGMGRMMPPA